MNEKPELEEILEIIIKSVENRNIVERYFKNPESTSAEEKQEAVKKIKDLLGKYPEFKAYFNPEINEETAKGLTERFKGYRKQILKIDQDYKNAINYIKERMQLFAPHWYQSRECCVNTHNLFISELEHKKDYSLNYVLRDVDKVITCAIARLAPPGHISLEDSEWKKTISEYEETLTTLKERYMANKFAKPNGAIKDTLRFLDTHNPEEHIRPYPFRDNKK